MKMKIWYWVVPMFAYGTYRGWTSEFKAPFDLISHRVFLSLVNGVCYSSPMGIFKLIHTFNRLEIYYKKKSPKLYPRSYEEIYMKNHRVF